MQPSNNYTTEPTCSGALACSLHQPHIKSHLAVVWMCLSTDTFIDPHLLALLLEWKKSFGVESCGKKLRASHSGGINIVLTTPQSLASYVNGFWNVYWCFVLLHVYMCAIWVSDASGGQKRVLDSLELKSQRIVGHYMAAGNWTGIFCKNSQFS